ncbi:glycine rich domain-containing protein (plasmid) [Bacillus thuringiensis]|uniref:glycine rich domain-containing protein n=1 Tax=Bacillus thuringiensis TaxID=1428 RepID=UPI0022242CEB|nr:glycine rich domain-containing protein [Bacillus thuringiensis]UYX56199.1 glycine rich domain-containing protein [Bacillus thuringiensis]
MARVWTFNYTEAEQTFTPPVSGVYTIEVQGAQGGTSSSGGVGGLGSLISGDFTLEGGKPIYVMVGGQGKKVENGSVAGGWNGGGSIVNTNGSAASGGGSSDIRIGGMTLDKRIIVAAGGGGGGYQRTKGGYGGAKYGEAGEAWGTTWYGGAGAGPGYGGAASNATTAVTATSGTIGQGGKGVGYSGGGGGGGGGYFGGGGSIISGGGGGSSYNLGSNQLGQNSYRAGNGLVTITLKSEPSLLLIQDGDIIKTYKNNTWQTIQGGMNMPTVDEFKQHGMTDLSVIPESAWNQLESDNIKILVLTKDTSINSASVNVTAIPKRQLIMQETDMIFEKPIKSFTLTGTVQNESVLKIIASNDSGATWKAFNGVSWYPVDISDLDDIKSKGLECCTCRWLTIILNNNTSTRS